MMNRWIDKILYDDAYGIALRRRDAKEEVFYTRYPDAKYWYADPFVCHANGKEYVFSRVSVEPT